MKKYEGREGAVPGPGTIFVTDMEDESSRRVLPPPRRHSPDGFQWGYGGSGPADTALALLRDALGIDPSPQMYQRFKFEVVAGFADDFEITEQQIRDWVKEFQHGK